MIKSGGQLFATEGLRGLKALLLQGGRAWLLQNLQLSQRKALCNLHQEVCAEGRGRGLEEAAALRRGHSKLLSRKKKKKKKSQTKHPTPERAPLLLAPARTRLAPPASWAMHPSRVPPSGWKRGPIADPSRRAANGTPGSAKAREGAVCEVALPFGGRRDPDLHLPNGRRHWGRDRDPVRANEVGGRREAHGSTRAALTGEWG